jgi:hypothetical protein
MDARSTEAGPSQSPTTATNSRSSRIGFEDNASRPLAHPGKGQVVGGRRVPWITPFLHDDARQQLVVVCPPSGPTGQNELIA